MYDQYDLENSDWHESDMKAKIVNFQNLFNLNGLILDKRFSLFFPINHKTISGDRSSIVMLKVNVAKTDIWVWEVWSNRRILADFN